MQRNMSKFLSILVGTVGAIVIGLGAMTLVKDSSALLPKPYDVAMYDVYTDLLETRQQSYLDRLVDPQPKAVLIRVETESGPDHPILGSLIPEKRFKQAVDLAIADYLKRNTSILELQRRFNLATYDLITKAEEEAVLDKGVSGSACRVFQQKYGGYDRWVELSAVGFNQDQTVAVVYVVEWRRDGAPCSARRSGTAGYRMLQKRNGKWHLIENQAFSDVLTCY
jgi:hypothetical protein